MKIPPITTALVLGKQAMLFLLVGVSVWGATAGAAASSRIALAGSWRFEIAGADANAYTRELRGAIRLPGTMDDAELGVKNKTKPDLSGPYRTYNHVGPAWYQRDIEIPAAWQGQHITLLLERVRWTTRVWLDDKPLGMQDSLIAPHLYELGSAVTPGRHRLTICVDNSVKINLGPIVSALAGGVPGNMNGIIGRIELAATPPVWIADVQVYPDVDKKVAHVKVRIGNATGKAGEGTIAIGGKEFPAKWDASGGLVEADVDMSSAKLWDEFAPNLTEVRVKMRNDQRTVRFGMRKFATKGTQFAINDRPIFLRGTLECQVFPLTGYPPMDRPAWQKIFKTIKSYGLNFMRFHSWCPPEAAFAAADIEGVYLHVEGPMANVKAGESPDRDAFMEAEYERIVDTYGNHPSFILMALGNEFGEKGGTDKILTAWVDRLIQRDSRHLYSSAANAQKTANCQWIEDAGGRGIGGPGTKRDSRKVVAANPLPYVGHEIGQWVFFPDFRTMAKYTGVMTLKNFELIRQDLEKKHLLGQVSQFIESSGRFAVRLYKEEVEMLERTPKYAGFSLLDLHDYPTQGTALIGPLDEFWDNKGFITPEQFRRFCGSTVPLLRLPKRTFGTDETLEATLDLAHYGPAGLANITPVWAITDEAGHELARGKLPTVSAPTGELTGLGAIKLPLEKMPAPAKLTVAVSIPGTAAANDWDIWLYPPPRTDNPLVAPPGVVVCTRWDQAKAALAGGKTVLYFDADVGGEKSIAGKFLPVFWSPVAFPKQKPNTLGLLMDPKHPLLAKFPTAGHSDWQWYDLMQRSRYYILDDLPESYRPIVQVIDNYARNHKLGVIFEARMGKGQLLVCGLDLPGQIKDPAARQLLSGIYAYLTSPAFHPTQELSEDLGRQLLLSPPNGLRELGAKVLADSQHGDQPVGNVLDGRPHTLWHTRWGGTNPPYPHHLVLEFPKPITLNGLTCLPRQDGDRNGWIKDYAVYLGDDGKTWGQPVATGHFPQTADWHPIKFDKPVQACFVKFEAIRGFGDGPHASLAEIDLIK